MPFIKVIIDKSRGEVYSQVSLFEQDTIENVSYALSMYIVTFTLMSILMTDYTQKKRGQTHLYQRKSDYMDRALACEK